MGLLIQHLSLKWQSRLGITASLIVLMITAILAWQGSLLAWQSVVKHTLTFGEVMIPVIYAQWTVPAGFILLFLVCLLQTIRLITGMVKD